MAYTKNRRPVSYLKDQSPFEDIYGQLPKLTNMYPLESTVYVVINKKIKNHLKPNAEKEILIEYDDDTIYRVYIPISQKIERVKDLDIYDHKPTPKTDTEFGENLTESVVDSTMMNSPAIHTESTAEGQEIQPQAPQSTETRPHIKAKSPNITIQKPMTSQQQESLQKIPQKYATMRSSRKATRVDFSMNPTAYNVITSASPTVFHLAMRELLAN
ncbi:hypothetical protein G7Y79_00020g049250 [Physcia stellaris]|nr:hypothetical protein G7Y79_00020g049250 [Physcia stellaris]